MRKFDIFSIHTRDTLSDEKKIKSDIFMQMVFRYSIIGFATVSIYVSHTNLPFPYPHFFLVACFSLLLNTTLHLLTFNPKWRKYILGLFPYGDVLMSAPVFVFTGGFLSPFVITHIATNIGSVIVYTHNRNLAKHTFLLLLISYVGVSLFQITGIIPVYIPYAEEMMQNRSFFVLVTGIVSLIIIASYVLINALNFRVHQMLDEMSAAFFSIVKGTSPVAGTNFFNHLVKSCTDTLHVNRVILGELVNNDKILNIFVQAGLDECCHNKGTDIEIGNTIFERIINNGELILEYGENLPEVDKWLVNGLDHWSIFGVVLRDSNGVPIGIFCVVSENNITNKYLINAVISVFSSRAAAELERKRIDERQKQTEQQLTQANKLNVIGQLAGGITHDLNNLLTVGMGYTNMLVGKIEKSTQLHMFASQVLSTTKRASELTSMLAKYLRKEKIETVPIDLNNLVNDTVLFMENMISKNIEIVRILSFDSMKIMGDRTKLQNVLMNLIINARDAIGKNRGCITVKTVFKLNLEHIVPWRFLILVPVWKRKLLSIFLNPFLQQNRTGLVPDWDSLMLGDILIFIGVQ